jgi:regulation of enolase protein 1 (concanavalin A-like superfamily)
VGQNGATVSWLTNEAATSQVQYGTSTAYGQATALDVTYETDHLVTVSGLVESTTYHFRVVSVDEAGNAAASPDATFTTAPGSGLPAQWLNADVGGVSVAGSADYDGGVFTVTGSGVDIWDAADSFHFVHASMQGDGEITARVTSMENTDPWALAGVMIREDLTSNSKHVMAAVTPSNGTGLTWRSATGGQSNYDGAGSGSTPEWVRVERRGNTFTAYRSSDGSNWVVIRSVSVNMGQDVYVGLAVTSHENGVSSTATFESVTATGG